VLLVELDEEPLEDKVAAFHLISQKFHLTQPLSLAREPEHQEALWQVRKAIYPTLYRYDARKKPVNFADDVVVPVGRLSDLIAYLNGLFKEMTVPVAIYGHVGMVMHTSTRF